MSVPIFVDLQSFLVGRHFVVKEFAALKDGFELSHYIFRCSKLWSNLTKVERYQAMWLIENYYGIQWEDEIVPYSIALITKTMIFNHIGTKTTDDKIVVYVKIHKKQEWLRDLLLNEARGGESMLNISRHITKTESLNKLDVTHTLRCQKHVKKCALQNVFKLFNWWHYHHE